MEAGWVAASVRARSMAQRRVGAGTSRTLATEPTLDAALSSLQESSYAERLHGVSSLFVAERAVQEACLWQLRVLAGWLPASGTALARAAAGIFEIENIVALAHQLDGGPPAPEPYRLGTLATAWHRLSSAGSREELATILRTSPWKGADGGGRGPLRPALTVAWVRRLAVIAPPAQSWCGAVCVLTAARSLTVDGVLPERALLNLLRPVLGRAWESADSISNFRTALPPSLQKIVGDIDSPTELWRAEARAHTAVESDGFRLLRHSRPGPDVVLGAIAVLSMDAWRVRAALAAAAAGAGSSEVLDEAA
ncbi:V-type ATPase subunit [Arthrobacter psychrochitiniphilus]|uniref:V-type ATPase subunit n=1 Tax=Arthrobacter psychrochitiniphilus TaxID=291045 RepID=UPI0014747F52|nr:V-type ATPase subunit [Arthrobacter psychrochitiniphilus]NYG17183.1 hypothetical protein [Arthrobacter psychrochitiniphilus]